MKVLVVGAGGQGGPCASILDRDDSVEEIKLVDLDEKNAEKVALKVGGGKIKIGKVDGTDSAAVAKLAENVDVVMDFTMPWMAASVMKGALNGKSHYVNTAFDTPFWEELVKDQPLSLDKEFKEAGLTALLGCGMAPGFINVLIRECTDKLDKVDQIKIRLGKARTGGGEYDYLTEPWNPGWSPIQALKDCHDEAICFEDGEYKYMEPYSGIEEWNFENPIGRKLVSHHSHEEPYSIPRTIGKGIKYCDFKYYVSHQPATLVSLGLSSQEEVNVKGVLVKPIDLVTAVIPKSGDSFLNEDPGKYKYEDEHGFMDMVSFVEGEKDGEYTAYLISCPKMTAPAKRIYELFGTSLVNVALPSVIGAKLACSGAKKGVIFSEELDSQEFLRRMKDTGYPYKWKIEEIKEKNKI